MMYLIRAFMPFAKISSFQVEFWFEYFPLLFKSSVQNEMLVSTPHSKINKGLKTIFTKLQNFKRGWQPANFIIFYIKFDTFYIFL
jgi:hypothetical protein